MAYEIGLSPREFWSLTWWEFSRCLKGYNDRQKSTQERLAWALCVLGNRIPFNKKPLRMEQLMGRRTHFNSAEEFREYMRQRAGK